MSSTASGTHRKSLGHFPKLLHPHSRLLPFLLDMFVYFDTRLMAIRTKGKRKILLCHSQIKHNHSLKRVWLCISGFYTEDILRASFASLSTFYGHMVLRWKGVLWCVHGPFLVRCSGRSTFSLLQPMLQCAPTAMESKHCVNLLKLFITAALPSSLTCCYLGMFCFAFLLF